MRILSLIVLLLTVAASPLIAQQPESSQIKSLENLMQFFQRIGVNSQADLEQGFIAIPVKKEAFEAVHVVRWATSDGVVHFIQVIPLKVAPERIAALESAIVRLNHSYPVPGLGFNHETGTLYFRMTVPFAPAGYLTEQEAQEYFGYCINQAYQFVPTLTELIEGRVEPENVLQYHRQVLQDSLGPYGIWKKTAAGSEWTLILKANGETTLQRDGEVVVDSMAKVEGTTVTFDDINGALAADDSGVYDFTVQGGQLVFVKKSDTSTGREQILTGDAWTR
ncbi:YbjN domain-containing protein [Thalassoglobus sp. JC818]|uniref:YbjN domain-containing protein n=1 Tax=Thalassoglobus sp. JC818 TaxID=3232136 RepID=UPI00345B115B